MLDNMDIRIFLLASVMVLVVAIASLRFVFAAIYATGNQQDPLLLGLMKQANIPNWQALEMKSGLSSAEIWLLRDGEGASLKLSELTQIAKTLAIHPAELLQKLDLLPASPELEARRSECLQLAFSLKQLETEKEALRQEGLRLHAQMQQQRLELSEEFRESTFEQLQTLLTNYPSIHQMVSFKPELPAKNLLSMFTPLDNLLQEWGFAQIGKPWKQIPYDPQIHQPDAADIQEGELVYIRFVGYQHQDRILYPAKVSRTLPGR